MDVYFGEISIMKLVAFTVALFCALSITAQSNQTSILVHHMLQETPVLYDLEELCDRIGGRVTGSEANEEAVDWALQKFRDAGVNVTKESFEISSLWLERATTASISGDVRFLPQVVSKYHSPPGTYSGRLINVGSGSMAEWAALGTQTQDAVVLVSAEVCSDINGLFVEYAAASDIEDRARAAGVKAIVFQSSRPQELLYTFTTQRGIDNELPQLIMSREDAKRCLRVLRTGRELFIDIKLDAETGGKFKSHNVIGEIPGSVYPDEIVLIGAHIDSWGLGTGANDNGCNVSMLIDLARQIKILNLRPKRTIRFALWNGEEQGFFGSWAYTKSHTHELDNHVVSISIDIGSGAIKGFFTNGRDDLQILVDSLMKPFLVLGPFNQVNLPIVGTDNFDFMLQGLPNLVANHASSLYGYNYHASSDTFDKVDQGALKLNAAIVSAIVMQFADGDDVRLPRQNRRQINSMFSKHNTDASMKMFNVWDSWERGERGIK